jgi:hypothetical protein
MTPFVTMRRALSDEHLLGGVLGGDSWLAWRVLLIAAMGEALTDEERAIFAKLTGRGRESGERCPSACECWGGQSCGPRQLYRRVLGGSYNPSVVSAWT